MQADDDVPSFKQLVEHAEALHHDVDQAEQADDDRDPYDAAEHDLVEFIRKHRPVVLDADLDDRGLLYRRDAGFVVVYGPRVGERREISFGPADRLPPGDRSS